MPRLLQNASISLVARDAGQNVVGVLLGVTDFAYWLFVTDLGVDKKTADADAGNMEHGISEESLNALKRLRLALRSIKE